MMLGLYVHIPFCLKKCHYCDFVITTKRKVEDRARYLDVLEKEIRHAREKYGPFKFDTFYLGGGTPSSLEAAEFERVVRMLRNHFEFVSNHEFTVEVNPGDVDAEKIAAYKKAGVNRVSLGVQAFQERLLKEMNRSHGRAEISATVQMLREAGIHNLSMDMILNLPEQTEADVEETLRELIALKPNQVSVYDLDVHEKTVYGLRRREGRLPVSDDETHARMAEKVSAMLGAAGIQQYELSNFAKPGFESRHNLIYWNNQSYLGLGPGAFSYMDGVRYQFSGSVESYLKKVEANDFQNETEDVLTPEEIEKETLLTGLRLSSGFDLRRLTLRRSQYEKAAAKWIQNDCLVLEGNRLTLTPRGRLLAEMVLQELAQV